jgi:hypothetical protein
MRPAEAQENVENQMETDRIALDTELGIFHRVPNEEEKEHFVIGRSCPCHPSLEIVDECTVIVDHKSIASVPVQQPN